MTQTIELDFGQARRTVDYDISDITVTVRIPGNEKKTHLMSITMAGVGDNVHLENTVSISDHESLDLADNAVTMIAEKMGMDIQDRVPSVALIEGKKRTYSFNRKKTTISNLDVG